MSSGSVNVKASTTEFSQVGESPPLRPSYFLPGKVHGKAVQFLIDSGSTANIIAQHVWERMSKGVRDQLLPYSSQGVLADGSQMEILGTIECSGRLRDIAFIAQLLVCPIREDGILGMPFLEQHSCVMNFGSQSLKIGNKDLKCTDRHGAFLQSKVQVVYPEVIPV